MPVTNIAMPCVLSLLLVLTLALKGLSLSNPVSFSPLKPNSILFWIDE